jgi:hypothetical protein
MNYSRENMARALDTSRGAGQRARTKVAPPALGAVPTEASTEQPEPRVFFSIEKKVGDATLHVGGGPGEEKAALSAINDAARRFKGNSSGE